MQPLAATQGKEPQRDGLKPATAARNADAEVPEGIMNPKLRPTVGGLCETFGAQWPYMKGRKWLEEEIVSADGGR